MESLSFQYPSWFILLCILVGAAYAGVLYFRDDTFREQSRFLSAGLAALRFVTVTLLCILLLSPIIKSLQTQSKKPVVVLAQDQSESIRAEMDEEALQSYRRDIENLEAELAEDFDLKAYAFGEDIREGIDFNFADKATNISQMLSTVYDLYSNQNLGAVILATDGIYNEGSNPIYLGNRLGAPIYTVALGDTVPKKDVVLKRTLHNRIAYLEDRFSVLVDIAAQNAAGNATTLNVYKVSENGGVQRLEQTAIDIDRNDFFATREFVLDADQSGVQRYRFSLSPVSGEVSDANNTKDIFIDVLDARQKILILAHAPHPDITSMRQSLERNKNYDVTVDYAGSRKQNAAEYDFVILHQLPSRRYPVSDVFNILQQNNIPRLFIAGLQTDFNRLNEVQDQIAIRASGRNANEVQATIAEGFALFNIDEELKRQLPNFAPLTAAFGEFEPKAGASVLMYQRIGKVDTQYPLFVMGEEDGARVGVLAAEGVWKWRLFDFLQNQSHNIFEEFLGKPVQYVSLKEDKRKFRVNLNKAIFDENEPVFLDAELYNQSYELINEPDVRLIVTNSEGNEFNYTFNKTDNAYSLNAGILPVGAYRFQASVGSDGELLTYNGQFSVQPIQLEIYETTADHNLLRLLSERFGGELIYPNQLISVARQIAERETIKPVIYTTTNTRPVINLKWIFILLMSLLTLEWFLRRYYGGY